VWPDDRASDLARTGLLALPALALAGLGAAHPRQLDAATAEWWTNLHVALLPVFPLLAVAQWRMLDGAPILLRWPGRVAAFGFGAFYTGLDAVDGIAGGAVVHAGGDVASVTALFHIGNRLGTVGAWSFLVANLLIVAAAFAADRFQWPAVLPGAALLLVASVSFLDSHIFWARGVITMLGVAAGMALLDIAACYHRRRGA
jgi:hypothetical protein